MTPLLARIHALRDRQRSIQLLTIGLLLAGVWGIAFVMTKYGMAAGLAVACAPGVLLYLGCSIQRPIYALAGLFVVNYFIMGLTRFMHGAPIGLLLDGLIFYNFFVMILHSLYHKIEWSRALTWLTLLAFVWMLYGAMELFNPQTVSATGWFSSVRSISFHFFFIVVLGQILLDDYRYLRYMLYIWSVLTLLAVAKALMQKYIGFSDTELYWLYVLEYSTTHIIGSGVRYFSFFSDAANFSASMGMALVVFAIVAIYFRNLWTKGYFMAVALLAGYAMLISGTRSALAIPFVGFMVYILLSKQVRIFILGSVLLVGAFCFLNYTYIGQGNAVIRRARSAFNPNDRSLVVRLENQQKLRVIMADKPFGAGIGHGGGKAKIFAPDAPLSQIPTDSWLVQIWVETGIVGLVSHLLILFVVLGFGGFQVMFRLQHRQLRGVIAAFTAGIAGVVAMSYANEILGQLPMGVILYLCMTFIALSPELDRKLTLAGVDKNE